MNKFLAVAGVIVLGTLLVGWVVGTGPLFEVSAQDNRQVTVEVLFRAPGDPRPAGEPCGYVIAPISATEWPLGKQVVVRDATETIVGTVDLADVFDLTQSSKTRPGTFDDNGLCNVITTITVPDSGFYTFSVEGHYRWTVAREDLERRSWTMPILFLS